jgi:small subunit ribosomal protein S12
MKNKAISKILGSNPQKRGIILKILTMKPKKPNSAIRKVAKIKIKDYNILAYIPGEGSSNISIHSEVLIRGGKVQDLPGVNYKIIRGARDCPSVLRVSSRSKYGTKRKNERIIKKNNKY